MAQSHAHSEWLTGNSDIPNHIFQATALETAERLENEARKIRTRYNDLAPISRLPPEILADVFVRCVPISVYQLQTDLSWLNLAHVNRRWRAIALACPHLWSTLILSRPNLTPLLLARAKNASLVVRADLGNEDFDDSPEPILLEHTARLGTLDIVSPQRYLATFMANLEQADSAPRLQCVKIINYHDEGEDEEGFHGDDEDVLWLPRNLFQRDQVLQSRKPGVNPLLRLHLDSCAFPWDSGWYSCLTHLHLEDIDATQCPTMEEFLAVLARSPALESLSLIHCTPTTHEGGEVVSLPRLSTLRMKSEGADPVACVRLWSFLCVPDTAVVEVSCIADPVDLREDGAPLNSDVADQSTAHAFIRPLADITPDAYDAVRIHYDHGLSLSLTHSARPEWSRKLLFSAPAKDWTGTYELYVTEYVRCRLDFSNVTALYLHSSAGMRPIGFLRANTLRLWDSLGREMPRLRMLHLSCGPALAFPDEFLDLFLEYMLTQAMLLVGVSHYDSCFSRLRSNDLPLPFRGPDEKLTRAWPALQRLTLVGFHMGGENYAPRHGPSSAEVLRALLWARRQGGAPITQLEIRECRCLNVADVAGLRVLAELEWDGKGSTALPVQRMRYEENDDNDSNDTVAGALDGYSVNVFVNMVLHSRLHQYSKAPPKHEPAVLQGRSSLTRPHK